MAKVLFLTHYFAPDITSNAVIATELARQLVQMGHQVTVVTSVPHYDKQEVQSDYRGVIARHTVEMDGQLHIWHTWLFVPRNKKSVLQRFISYFSYNIISGLLSLFLGRYDIVITMSPPLTNGLIAGALGTLGRSPMIYNIQDLFPDLPVELGLINNDRLISILYALENLVYRQATRLTVLSEEMEQKILAKGVPQAKISVIPNFADTDFVTPRPKDNPWSRQHHLTNRFVVMYTGNVGSVQGIDVLVEAATWLEDDPGIAVAIVGDGAAKESLVQRAQQLSLTNITFLPVQARENVPDLFASADVLLVSLQKGVAEHSVPSKTFTIMASGRPILASVASGSPVHRIVEKADCGFYVPPEDPPALAEMVRHLAANPQSGKQKGANGRQYVVEHYSARQIARRYHDLLTEVVRATS